MLGSLLKSAAGIWWQRVEKWVCDQGAFLSEFMLENDGKSQQQCFTYPYFSQSLEVLGAGKPHRCACQSFVLGWMVHHDDFDHDVISFAVLTLHKDIFCRSYAQQVGGRHHLPTEQEEKTKIKKTYCHLLAPCAHTGQTNFRPIFVWDTATV